MSGEIERHQPTEIERQAHWQQSAERIVARYAGFALAEDLDDHEKMLAVLSLIPMSLQVVEEARETIERLNNEVDRHRALLIEALARLEALDTIPGDPGGPFYCRDADDLAMMMRWIQCVRTNPPTWEEEIPSRDPLDLFDDDLEISEQIGDRAWELVLRLRQQMVEYYGRVAKSQPERAAAWRPWWRTRK